MLRAAVEVFARDYLSPPLLRALEAYREHFGHVRVPQSFEVPEGDPGWPIEVQGMNLGRRVAYLRQMRRDQIVPNNDIEKLDAIGFVWDVREWQWQRVLKSLHVYKELHGDLEALSDFVVPSEAPWPEDAWGIKLGNRVLSIRSNEIYVKDRPDRVAELNRIGFIWDVYEEHWQRMSPNPKTQQNTQSKIKHWVRKGK